MWFEASKGCSCGGAQKGQFGLRGKIKAERWVVEAFLGPRRNSRILLHLEKNQVVPPSSQDVALCRYRGKSVLSSYK